MIRVNLTPIDELENPYWYFPDIIVGILVMAAAYAFVQWQLDEKQTQLYNVKEETANYQSNFNKIKGDLNRIEQLETQVAELKRKLSSLKEITVTKISRFKPVIVLEHLQNLKPNGSWFTGVEIKNDSSFRVTGRAYDNILVAEFFTAIKATRYQQVVASDLRSQVYFDGVVLDSSRRSDTSDAFFPELGEFPMFSLEGVFAETSVEQKAEQDALTITMKNDQPLVRRF